MPHTAQNQFTNTMLEDRALVRRQRTLDALPLAPRPPMVEGRLQDPKPLTELERCHQVHMLRTEARCPQPRQAMIITQDDDIGDT